MLLSIYSIRFIYPTHFLSQHYWIDLSNHNLSLYNSMLYSPHSNHKSFILVCYILPRAITKQVYAMSPRAITKQVYAMSPRAITTHLHAISPQEITKPEYSIFPPQQSLSLCVLYSPHSNHKACICYIPSTATTKPVHATMLYALYVALGVLVVWLCGMHRAGIQGQTGGAKTCSVATYIYHMKIELLPTHQYS